MPYCCLRRRREDTQDDIKATAVLIPIHLTNMVHRGLFITWSSWAIVIIFGLDVVIATAQPSANKSDGNGVLSTTIGNNQGCCCNQPDMDSHLDKEVLALVDGRDFLDHQHPRLQKISATILVAAAVVAAASTKMHQKKPFRLGLSWALVLSMVLLTTDVASADFSDNCPEDCDCKWANGKREADCTRAGFTAVPTHLDHEIQILRLTHNYVRILGKDVFRAAGLLNLQRIFMSHCHLQVRSLFFIPHL